MIVIILIASIFLLFLGHILKAKRWEQFIEIYEPAPRRKMVFSLGIGYLINFMIPFRIGDIVRAIITGKDLKNGSGFSLATVILDRSLDLLFVVLLFSFFYFLCIVNDEIE